MRCSRAGKIDPDERYECRGYLDQPERLRCLIYTHQKVGHGPVDLSDALSRSCNVYFFQAAGRLGPQPIVDWARRFGIGRPTGVDLPFEQPAAPCRIRMQRRTRPRGSRPLAGTSPNTRSLAVGQSSLTTTPLQIARVMAAIANGGYLVTPVRRPQGRARSLADDDASPSLSHRVPIPGLSDGTLARIRAALAKAVADPAGTAYKTVRSAEIAIAGKRGTAQAGRGQADHAWFAGYAPADKPSRSPLPSCSSTRAPAAKPPARVARQLVEAFLADGVLQRERVALGN